MRVKIRKATEEDAEAACHIVHRSVTELCEADHQGDSEILSQWLDNKTPQNFRTWINDKRTYFLVAETDDCQLTAVAMASDSGEILLNYISPDHRFQGISKTILSALEARLQQQEIKQITLASTRTAQKFYRSVGYKTIPDLQKRGKLSCLSMVKELW